MGRKTAFKVGDIFGNLEVIDVLSGGGTGKHVKLNCLCHYCYNTKIINSVVIKRRNSCGCQQRNSSKWKHIGPKTKPWQLPIGESAKNDLEHRYKSAAKRKGREFTLSKEEFTEIVTGKCVYCGSQMQSISKGQGKTSGNFKYTGIDRIDSSKGYTKENSVSCCWNCNNMKGTKTTEDFMSHIQKIYTYRYQSLPMVTEFTHAEEDRAE